MARVETGHHKVQGTDYAYTLHGWIKAVNSNALTTSTDMGKDGAAGNAYASAYTDLHRYVAQDAAGYSLNYYRQGPVKDYAAIKTFNSTTNQNMIASITALGSTGTPFNLQTDAPDLYNGNISSMVTSIYDMDMNSNNTHTDHTAFPQITAYRYDQLHRIKQLKAYRDIDLSANAWKSLATGNYDGSYFTQFSYDKNGNITSQRRDGAAFMTGLGLTMDDLSYMTQDASATNPSNKLIGVNDAVTGAYTTDIKGSSSAVDGTPSTYDYDYDAIGSLIKDKKEFIQGIEWTVDRKVKKVIRDGAAMSAAGKNMPDLEFEYDANRQRILKIVKPHTTGGSLMSQDNWVYTYYVRDASGNISATYEKTFMPVSGQANTYSETLKLQEHDLYGSSRLGTLPANTIMGGANTFTAALSGGLFQNISYLANYQPPVTTIVCTLPGSSTHITCPETFERTLGNKRYELTNHLGNVLTVVSDRKLQVAGPQASTVLRRVFDDMDMSHVIGDPPSCVSNVGGKAVVNPTAGYSGINFDFPTVTGQQYLVEFDLDKGNSDVSDDMYVTLYDNTFALLQFNSLGAVSSNHYSYSWIGSGSQDNIKIYFVSGTNTPAVGALTPHYFSIDNFAVSAIDSTTTIVSNYKAEILETHDYYAGGMILPGRSFNSGDYRYGHNGQEKENEITQGLYSAEFWMYDSRIIRRWETDPVVKPWESPYACFLGNPIYYADPSGLDGEGPNGECPGDPGVGDHTYSTPSSPSTPGRFWERGEPGAQADGGSSGGNSGKAPPFYLAYGVPGGIYGTPSTLKRTYGDRNYTHYHTQFNNASGGFSLDEPNVFIQAQGRIKNNLQWSVTFMKQKIDPLDDAYKIEAPTAVEFGLAYRKQYLSKKWWFKASVDFAATFGPTYGAPMYNDLPGDEKQDGIGFTGLTFKASETERYMQVGYSGTALVRVNATFVKSITVFVAGNLHHMQGVTVDTDRGGQKIGYLGSAELTFGVGFDIGPYK